MKKITFLIFSLFLISNFLGYSINNNPSKKNKTKFKSETTNTSIFFADCSTSNTFDFGNSSNASLHLGQSFVACQTGTIKSIGVLVAATATSTGETINVYDGASTSSGDLLGSVTGQTLTENGGSATNYDVTDFSAEGISVVSGQTYTFDIPTTANLVFTTDNGIVGNLFLNGANNADNNDLVFEVIIENSSTAPSVTTTAVNSVANTSATLAGNVTADGGSAITGRGIVYSKTSDNANPLIMGSGVTQDTNGSTTGVFSESITGLAAGTQYSFKAYAINSIGTSYGSATTFTTTGKGWLGGSTNWATASNWSPNSIPIASDNLVIPNVGNKPIIFSGTNAVANNITIDASSSLNINTGGSLTMNGNLTQNGTFSIDSDATTNGSLIVKGTSTGNVTYKRYLTTSVTAAEGWHLIGAPVNGQSINSFSGSFITSGVKKAITPYVNNVVTASRWNYYTTDGTNPIASAGNFVTAKGYSAKIGTAGTLDFTGTLNTATSQPISITDGGDNPAGNRWNLISNPYTAALHGNNAADATNNFLKINIDNSRLDPTRAGLYLWNGSTPYVIKSLDDATFYIAPGQAFFVHAPNGGGTSVSFTEAMQTHQTGNVFLKSSANYPEMILQIANDTNTSSTKIRYIENKTTGLDVGSDVGTFTGENTTFSVFTQLVNNNEGIDFAIQALPNSGYESMVIPVGVNAEAGKEITFSLNTVNFSSELKIYLEDRILSTFTQLNETNSTYKITLKEALNGIGRFYMHTTNSSLNVANNLSLENVSIYKLDNNTLIINGLSQGNTSIKLFTVLGKQVIHTSFSSKGLKDISIPKLSSGVYFVQLLTNKGKLNKKIILE
ncbi:MAG: T9SS type A sorting domain-containing protein [Polaribacter sp.]